MAKRYAAEANDHVAMAQVYRGTRITQAAVHCDRLAALSRDEAKEATEAAAMHKQLAERLGNDQPHVSDRRVRRSAGVARSMR